MTPYFILFFLIIYLNLNDKLIVFNCYRRQRKSYVPASELILLNDSNNSRILDVQCCTQVLIIPPLFSKTTEKRNYFYYYFNLGMLLKRL